MAILCHFGRLLSQRKTGETAGGWDTYIYGPNEYPYRMKKFRSKQEIRRFFEQYNEIRWNWEDFDFNPFGSKGQHEMIQMMKNTEDKKMIPNLHQSVPVQSPAMQTFQHSQQNQDQNYPLTLPNTDPVEDNTDLVDELEIKPDISSFLQCDIKTE